MPSLPKLGFPSQKYARVGSQKLIFACPFSEGAGVPKDWGPKVLESNGMSDATWVAGSDGYAIEFGEATGQGVHFKDPASYLMPATGDHNFCFSCAVKPDLSKPNIFFSTLVSLTSGWLFGCTTSGELWSISSAGGGANNPVYAGAGTFTNAAWNYVSAWAYDDGAGFSIRAYVTDGNGQRHGYLMNHSAMPAQAGSDLIVGNWVHGGTSWNAPLTISDLRFWRNTLQLQEAAASFSNAGFF